MSKGGVAKLLLVLLLTFGLFFVSIPVHIGNASSPATGAVVSASNSVAPANQNAPVGWIQILSDWAADLVGRLFGGSYNTLAAVMLAYGYAALFVITLLEGVALPIPSEVVIPLAGYYASQGVFNPLPAFLAMMAGAIIGFMIIYYLGYYLGREFLYRHLRLFFLTPRSMIRLEGWFDRHGPFAVFFSRLLPVVRGPIGFPAGFAKMPVIKFAVYSTAGLAIWDAVLMAFGYFAISSIGATVIVGAIAITAILTYYLTIRKFRTRSGRRVG